MLNDQEEVVYEARNEDVSLEMMNIEEKNKFMDDEKQIAIISEAASSGISLQSDRRAKNRKRRVHITIELPWSADKAIQQFGRTHRSNQVNAPKYIFMISKLAGEKRFANSVAKRLESLGALTHGDRRATESRDLSQFNFDAKYSKKALETLMNVIQGTEVSPIPLPTLFKDIRSSMVSVGLLEYNKYLDTYTLDKDYTQINRFLNRLLGMKVEVQNCLFDYFIEIMDTYIRFAKRSGEYDQGIMVLSSNNGRVRRLEHTEFKYKHSESVTTIIELHKVAVERGISWERAFEIYGQSKDPEEGFYLAKSDRFVRRNIALAIKEPGMGNYTRSVYRIYKANTGVQSKPETLSQVRLRGKKVGPDEAKEHWSQIYNLSEKNCSHRLWYDKCIRTTKKMLCDEGKRNLYYYVLSGSILEIWSTIENILPQSQSKLQIIRLNSQDGLRVVGIVIPQFSVERLVEILQKRTEVSQAANDAGMKANPSVNLIQVSDDESNPITDYLDFDDY